MPAALAPPPFAGEEHLSFAPPDHDTSRRAIVGAAVLLSVVVFVAIPKYADSSTRAATADDEKEKEDRRLERQRRERANQMGSRSFDAGDADDDYDFGDLVQKSLQLFCLFPKTLYAACFFCLVLFSTNNHHVARRVFQAPIFRPSECQEMVRIARSVARRNYDEAKTRRNDIQKMTAAAGNNTTIYKKELGELEKLLKWPQGWRKDRHGSYPTTDLNLAADFDQKDKDYAQRLLDARLAPLLERVYGIPRGALRADDVFLVRYDGDGEKGGQRRLARHRDGTILSFNILLNEEFEGGGTRFFLPGEYLEAEGAVTARPGAGEGVFHHSAMEHEGLATTGGTRYILVGFLSVDRVHHGTGRATNVGLFPTWLCVDWLYDIFSRKVQEAISNWKRVPHPVRQLLLGASVVPMQVSSRLVNVVDGLAPFGIVKLIDDENYDGYFASMDEHYGSSCDPSSQNSIWFDGNRKF